MQRDRGLAGSDDRFVMALPESAIHTVAPRHIEALLARELGHHLGGPATSGLLAAWYALPGRIAARLGALAVRLLLGATKAAVGLALLAPTRAKKASVRALDRIAVWVAVIFFALPIIAALAVYVVPVAAASIAIVVATAYIDSMILRKKSVLVDRFAIELGYGSELTQLSAMGYSARGRPTGNPSSSRTGM
ncbi:hypothetical protein [Nocardia noduli]|uniref:hypothetical protein n=1 Tax=Nocardia noduli TaxID=2815722 RepID=UPI001C22695A|nr:hypothetical protein [Nocardia noduli]